VAAGHLAGDEFVQLPDPGHGFLVLQVDEGQIVDVSDRFVDVARLHRAVPKQGLQDRGLGVVLPGLVDLLGAHPELVKENFEDLIVSVHGREKL
jgi:hypothetical protein